VEIFLRRSCISPRVVHFLEAHPSSKKFRMAGGKKKKKPASNPARGFATTSIASKPKVELPEAVDELTPLKEPKDGADAQQIEPTVPATSFLVSNERALTAEEFEKQLEESELQVLVEKHAQKSKRDAARQKTRLETDRRLLRSQAESLNTRKWLPPELMEEILDLIKAEGRFIGQSNETLSNAKQASEEELTIRLWTLQQALLGSGFVEEKMSLALLHVLDISDKISVGSKDSIWGMEEAMDWLARNCSRDELPDYENWQRKAGGLPKSQPGQLLQNPYYCAA
jgi:ATP-dependent RNA helicase DHX29